ncbi:hypothetical protein HEP81_08040 (plasmid) [Streptomyces griseofuscus]|uniref:Uncharacterized protein n=1 Tax=Streptomyces griseofuscus TaxID=146922 RepID=A0A7H1QD88_9ACTN|nr:hypothetical protein HEP81_08040 [Streptomyces griseofuscus]
MGVTTDLQGRGVLEVDSAAQQVDRAAGAPGRPRINGDGGGRDRKLRQQLRGQCRIYEPYPARGAGELAPTYRAAVTRESSGGLHRRADEDGGARALPGRRSANRSHRLPLARRPRWTSCDTRASRYGASARVSPDGPSTRAPRRPVARSSSLEVARRRLQALHLIKTDRRAGEGSRAVWTARSCDCLGRALEGASRRVSQSASADECLVKQLKAPSRRPGARDRPSLQGRASGTSQRIDHERPARTARLRWMREVKKRWAGPQIRA